MSGPVLQVEGLTKTFGGLTAVDKVNFTLPGGGLHAIIGPNGAGKTTLIDQISGMMQPDSGQILFDGGDITHMSAPNRCHAGLVRSYQITSILKNFPVADHVTLGFLESALLIHTVSLHLNFRDEMSSG